MSSPEVETQEFRSTIEIENVVAASDLGVGLDLETLAMDLRGAQYNPEDFPGIVYRSNTHKVTTLIFRSGKIVTTGGQSPEETTEALDELLEELDNLGIEHDKVDPTIQNIVGSADLEKSLNLNAIAIGFGLEVVEYEPEQFPGLIYRPEDTECVSLLFGSGKVVLTGGKSTEDITEALDVVVDRLNELSLL